MTPATDTQVTSRRCVHCGRRCDGAVGGFTRICGHYVCASPTTSDRPNCFRMVTVKFHPLHDCPECTDTHS